MKFSRRLLAGMGLVGLVGLTCAPSFAQEASDPTRLLIAGTQIGGQSTYTYAGIVAPTGGGQLGDGWFYTGVVSWLTYEYDKDFGAGLETLKTSAHGVEIAKGYARSGPDYWLNMSVGLGYRDFRLSPDIATEKPRGGTLTLTPQIQGQRTLSDGVQWSAIGNYSFGADSFFTRTSLDFRITDQWWLGPEAGYQEGKEYRIRQLGLLGRYRGIPGLSLDFALGQQQQKDGERRAYGSAALVKNF